MTYRPAETSITNGSARAYDEPQVCRDVTVLISNYAIDVMRQETARYAGEDQETGGIVIGKWLDDRKVLIVAATDAGPMADHQPFTFAIDVEHANNELERWIQRYPGADYMGEWHKHPPTLYYPSGGDLYTARRLLSDPSYPTRLVNPITIAQNGRIAINFFYLDGQRASFERLEPRVVGEAEILQFEPQLSQSSPLAFNSAVAYPTQRGATQLGQREAAWWLVGGGLERLAAEKALLEQAVQQHRVKDWSDGIHDQGSYMFRVLSQRYPGLETQLECYGQYPANPPSVQVFYKGQPHEMASNLVTSWQASTHIVAIAAETERKFRSEKSRPLVWAVAALIAVAFAVGLMLLVFATQSGKNGLASPTFDPTFSAINSNKTAFAATLSNGTQIVNNQAATQSSIKGAQAQLYASETANVNNANATVAAAANGATSQTPKPPAATLSEAGQDTTSNRSATAATRAVATTPLVAPTPTPKPASQPFFLTLSEAGAEGIIQVKLEGKAITLNGSRQYKVKFMPIGYTILLPSKLADNSTYVVGTNACAAGKNCTVVLVDTNTGKEVSNTVTISGFNPAATYQVIIDKP